MKFLVLSICTLGGAGAGIGLMAVNNQIVSSFQELKRDNLVKADNNGFQEHNFNAWNLIYSSGSISYLRQLINQIQLKPNLSLNQIDIDSDAMIISSLSYLPRLKNLLNSFFKDLNWKTLIAYNNIPPDVKGQAQLISTNFLPFKTKFFAFSNWVELGVIVLVIEALFLLSLIASIVVIALDKKLKVEEKIKWILYYLFTNLFGWIYLNWLRNKLSRAFGKKSWTPERKQKKDDYQLLSYSDNKSEIVLSELSFSQDNYQILKNINLELKKNEFYAIIGPNGAGKTTLLKNIGGILNSVSGKIEIGGRQLQSIPKKFLWKKIIYIPQELEIQPDTPVYDFLLYSRYIFLPRTRKATPEDHLKVLGAIKKCGLEAFRYSRMGELSGGQRQKVILASIMVKEAEIILLDEPTTHLDIENRLFLISFFKELRNSRKIVIANLHNFAEIAQLSSKIIAIKNGVLQKVSSTEEALEPEFLNELYDLKLPKQKWKRILNASLLDY